VLKGLSEDDGKRRALVVGADTVVAKRGRIFEKPVDDQHAFEVLKEELSGQQHLVCTGVVLLVAGRRESDKSFHEVTKVNFDELSEDVVQAYVASGEPGDKAGGYGIQVRT